MLFAQGNGYQPQGMFPPALSLLPDMRALWGEVELDFDTAAERIIRAHQADGASHDLPIADLKSWSVVALDERFALVTLAGHHSPKPLRANAFGSLMTRIGAPSEFIRRLPAPLQLATSNFLLAEHKDNTAATLRLRGDEVSAVVSDRYAPLDPVELVDTIRSALVRLGMLQEVRVRGVATGLVDNIRLMVPSEEVAVRLGDISAIGLDISSSNFARSAIHVVPMVWRLVCSNGLRTPTRGPGMSFRHVGDARRVREGLAEAIPSALTHARGVMAGWRRAVSYMMDDVQEQIQSLRELTIQEKKNVEVELLKDVGEAGVPSRLPLYNVINSITAAAKSSTPARRLEMEAMAGEFLTRHVGTA
jgi:hypothetical protein